MTTEESVVKTGLYNLSTKEADAEHCCGQYGLKNETLSQTNKSKKGIYVPPGQAAGN